MPVHKKGDKKDVGNYAEAKFWGCYTSGVQPCRSISEGWGQSSKQDGSGWSELTVTTNVIMGDRTEVK